MRDELDELERAHTLDTTEIEAVVREVEKYKGDQWACARSASHLPR